jgi:hypothetical protein
MTVVDQTGSVEFLESEWPRYEQLLSAHFTAKELKRLRFITWMIIEKKLQS